ncbi:MAG: phosphoribosylglycinamide formyltransferase [Phycisphaerales bacterium]|nr:phosphoribosylglycinamide formyltransferase [Phycisphaerales bacterium]
MSSQQPLARLAVLLSGSGRTLLNLLDSITRGDLRATIPLVIASRECPGAERARAAGLRTLVIPGKIPGSHLGALLDEHRIDLVVLAGYLKLIDIPPAFEGRMVNIHPSLLPDFGGPGMYGDRVHAAVLAAGRTESGCTVHLVDPIYDRGTILAQARVPVLAGDDVHALAARVFEAECRLYPGAVQQLIEGRVGGMRRAEPRGVEQAQRAQRETL